MSLQQPLFSLPKLLFNVASKKKTSLQQFTPFSIRIENIYANHKQLTKFRQMFGEPDDIPTFAFITAFRASLQCLAQAQIPSSLLGLIHLSSEFQLHNKLNWLMPFTIKITVSSCIQTDKGLEYCVITDFYQRGSLTLTNTNTMLDKSKKYRTNSPQQTNSKPTSDTPSETIATWPIRLMTAWSYARASGDFNPIHLHKVLAKQFGLPNTLIHGMYNASKTLQQLLEHNAGSSQHFLIEFNRPCFMPNQVLLKRYEETNEYGLFSEDGQDRFLKLTLGLEADSK